MTSQEMMKTQCKPGYWFVNTANLGDAPDWQQQPERPEDRGLLFGYEEKALLAKQYK